jgi:predicted AlkP superfamily phosphohydrolase/phosphomutase
MGCNRLPLVIFALDSANIELVEKWSGEGFLPNMAAMMQAGSTLEVGGPGVFEEIGSWLSAFSGVAQTEHGFHCSRRLKHGSYELEIAGFDQAGVMPFWGREADSVITSAILDPPEPFIAPGVRGIQVTGLNMHQEKYVGSSPHYDPPDMAYRLKELMDCDEELEFDEFGKSQDYYVGQLQRNLDRMERRCRAFRQLLHGQHFDLIVIGFGEVHDAAHMLWNFEQDLRPDVKCSPELAHGVRTLYSKVDEEIGRFLDELPSGSQGMILSCYGIKDQYPTARLGELLLDRLRFRVPLERKLSLLDPVGIARKLVPETMRYRLSHYFGFGFQQKLLHENFATGTDYSKTRAFTIPSLYQNWIRVNLKGREPEGIVDLSDYPALLDEIEQTMRQMVDPATGQSAVSSVLHTVDLSRQDPRNCAMPDLIVHWKASRSLLRRVTHPSGELRQSKPGFYRSSFHKFPGFLIWQGPGANPGGRGACGILDIAPTCLDLLGLPGADELKGRSLVTGLRESRIEL